MASEQSTNIGVLVWQGLVSHQLALVGRRLPATLQGSIRFHAPRENRSFFLRVNGPATGFVSAIQDPQTTVEIDEAALSALLSGRDAASPAFDVSGDADLFQSFFTELKRLFVPTSPLLLRESHPQRGL